MRTQQCYDDRRVYEDDGVRDDDEGRALNLSAVEVLASLLFSSEIIAAFQEQACDDGQGSSEASQCVRDGHSAVGGARRGVSEDSLASTYPQAGMALHYPPRPVAMMRY